MEDPQDKLRESGLKIPRNNKVQEFMDLMFSEECVEDPDCEEVISPCCSGKLKIVFGSCPLKAECLECKEKFLFRDLILN